MVVVSGRKVKAIVDSGCSMSVVRSDLMKCSGNNNQICAFDGRKVSCSDPCLVDVQVGNEHLKLNVVGCDNLIDDFDVMYWEWMLFIY